jgi:transposase, IS5 family
MAGLAILKHTYDLSDEGLCERWVENPYYQCFCGGEFFQHRLVFDRSSLTSTSRTGCSNIKEALGHGLRAKRSKNGGVSPAQSDRQAVWPPWAASLA